MKIKVQCSEFFGGARPSAPCAAMVCPTSLTKPHNTSPQASCCLGHRSVAATAL